MLESLRDGRAKARGNLCGIVASSVILAAANRHRRLMECWPLLPCWCWGFCSIGGYGENSIGYGWLLPTLSPLLSFVTTKDKPNAAAQRACQRRFCWRWWRQEVFWVGLAAMAGMLQGMPLIYQAKRDELWRLGTGNRVKLHQTHAEKRRISCAIKSTLRRFVAGRERG